jgi:trk system potassium uptake protein
MKKLDSKFQEKIPTPKEILDKLLERNVSRYMSSRILLLDEAMVLSQATAKMQKKNCNEIIVINKLAQPLGIVTGNDILRRVGEQFTKPQTTRLDDVMTFPLVTIKHNENLRQALEKMRRNKIRKLAVTSDFGSVIGILFSETIANLIRNSISKKTPAASTFSAVLWNLGSVLSFAGVLMIIPAILSTALGETDVATGIFLMVTLFLISGFLLNSYGSKHPLNLRAMSVLVFSSFVILVLFGTIPYLYISPYDSEDPIDIFSDSFFSSSAAFTTAGVTLFDTPEDLPQSFTFYRGFSQFVGGLSFIYLIMTAFYPEEKLHSMHGFISGQTPRLKELFGTITIVFSIYAVIIASLLFYFGSENIIDNFSLAMSTLSTGGFLPDSQIFSKIGMGGEFVLIAGMILGTLPFAFHYGFVRKKFLSAKLSREVLVYLGLLAAGLAIFVLATQGNIFEDAFTVIATSTTAGFQVVDMSTLAVSPKIILTMLMLIGGCGFSTAGGIKIFRLIDLSSMKELFSRKKWSKASTDRKNDVISILIVIFLYPTIPLLGALYLSTEGFDFYDSYFETIGAITTAGLGSGILGPSLDPLGKIIASFLMILGRLEIIIIIFMFIPKFVTATNIIKK